MTDPSTKPEEPPAQPPVVHFHPARLAKFLTVGGAGVVVNLGLLYTLVEFVQLHYAFASLIAIETSILANYAFNRYWTWRDGDRGLGTLFHFQAVAVVGMLLQWTVLTAGVVLFQLWYLFAAALGIVFSTAWNFSVNHFFTFAHKTPHKRTQHRRLWMYVGATFVQVAAAALFAHAWDEFVFTRSSENLLVRGETPYETIELDPAYTYPSPALPPFPQWYAYPPLPLLLSVGAYAPYFAIGHPLAIFTRIFVKLPLVVGALALPYLARRLALDAGTPRESANRLEKILLFNPFLILQGSAWGMTEILLAAFLTASFLYLVRGRHLVSGVLFGLASLVKIFPIFLYPLILAWILGRPDGRRKAFRHAVASGGTFVLVSLPFFLPHPHGFLRAVLLMHYGRPPSGFSFWQMPDYAVTNLLGDAARATLGSLVALLSLGAFAVFLSTHALRVYRHQFDITRLLERVAILFVLFLVLGKVVHEQYIALALILITLAAYVGTLNDFRYARFIPLLTGAALVASLLKGIQLLALFPPDLAQPVFGLSSPELIELARVSLHAPYWLYIAVTHFPGAILLAWSFWRFLPVLRPFVAESLHDFAHAAHALSGSLFRWTPRKAIAGVVLAGMLLVPTTTIGLLFHGSPAAEAPPSRDTGSQVVGAYYEIWWRNPSFDAYAKYGHWEAATTTPAIGFYTSNTGMFREAIREMRDAGVDFALLPIRTHGLEPPLSFAYNAEQNGFRFAPLFDLQYAQEHPTRLLATPNDKPLQLPTTKESFEAIETYLGVPGDALESEALLRIEGRPVVFLQNLPTLSRLDTEAERDFVRPYLLRSQPAALLTQLYGSEAWRSRTDRLDPEALPATAQRAELLRMWDEAYRLARQDGWNQILDALEETVPDISLIVDETWTPATGIAPGWVAGRFRSWDSLRAGLSDPGLYRFEPFVFKTLHPAYNASVLRPRDPIESLWNERGLVYAQAWADTVDEPFVLLYSWNQHQDGTAIEATLEAGDQLVDATRRWTALGEPKFSAPAS